MVSNKARRAQIEAKRSQQRLKQEHARVMSMPEAVRVNVTLLSSSNSYGVPEFVRRGYYVDVAFTCKDCGSEEAWTARQQKWWYEVAKGNIDSTANRCRACRKKERDRKKEARMRSGHSKDSE